MKITGVETVLYEYELSRPIGDVNIPDGMRRRADLAVFSAPTKASTASPPPAGSASPPSPRSRRRSSARIRYVTAVYGSA